MGGIGVLCLFGFFIWIVVQSVSEKRHDKWAERFKHPLVLHVHNDVKATWKLLRTWPVRTGDRYRMWRLTRNAKRLGL